MRNFFEINRNQLIQYGMLEETPYAIIDDFFSTPDDVITLLHHISPNFHKEGGTSNSSLDNGVGERPVIEEKPTGKKNYNGEMFKDMRHEFYSDMVLPAYEHIFNVLKYMGIHQIPADRRAVISNCFTFKRDPFNDFENNYWWPHRDHGYSALVYLNHNDNTGTNVYKCLEPDYEDDVREHEEPWRPKERYEKILNFEPAFNRCILFNAGKYHHGMHVENWRFEDTLENDTRMNLGFFFTPPPDQSK